MTQSTLATSARYTPAIQDYLKSCYRLTESGDTATVSKLAQALTVAMPSVTNMIKRLERLKLAKKGADGVITLTAHGRSIALEVVRHHRLLETFLVDDLGMEWAEAHQEAEVLEHYISERLEELLDRRLSRPKSDPHGEPIPAIDGTILESKPPSLLDHPAGSHVVIERVETQNSELLQYLQDHGLVPDAHIYITFVAPFNGPISLEVNGTAHHISREVAACVSGCRKR